MEQRPHYRTIVLSDIHLGTTHSKVNEVSNFLSTVDCECLILNCDIVDEWPLEKAGTKTCNAQQTRFLIIIINML